MLLESLSLFPLDPPLINTTYQAQSAMDLGVTSVGVAGQNATVEFIMGQSVALVCAFTGIEQATAQWSLDGIVVMPMSDPDITISATTDPNDPDVTVSTLIITNLMSTDEGNYECTASNDVLNAEDTANVFVAEEGQFADMCNSTLFENHSIGEILHSCTQNLSYILIHAWF